MWYVNTEQPQTQARLLLAGQSEILCSCVQNTQFQKEPSNIESECGCSEDLTLGFVYVGLVPRCIYPKVNYNDFFLFVGQVPDLLHVKTQLSNVMADNEQQMVNDEKKQRPAVRQFFFPVPRLWSQLHLCPAST